MIPLSTPLSEQLAPPGGWHPANASRIAPIDLRGSGSRARLLAWALGLFVKGDPPAIFLVLMRHWRLFRAWLSFAARLMPFGRLDRRDTELAILRVGWLCRCRYEWGQHVLIGHYQMLAGLLNSLGLPLEPSAEEALALAPIHGAAPA